MNNLKKITALLLALAVILPFSLSVSAYDKAYNNDIGNPLYIDHVKDQGDSAEPGLCFYYALVACAENYVKKYHNKTVVFDENALYENLGETKEYEAVIAGISGAALTAASGGNGDTYAFSSVKDIRADEARDFDSSVKKAVKEYGAVAAVINVCGSEYGGMKCETHYTKENCTYCYADESHGSETHAVAIVGWDDNEQAWLCKNSYGYEYGFGGFFWLGYSQPIISAAAVTVSVNGEIVPLQEELNWDDYYITSVYVQAVSDGNLNAYGVDQNGEKHTCFVSHDYNSNYYVVAPPDNAFFSSETLCWFNGNKLDNKPSDEKEWYKFENGVIGIESKNVGAYSVVKVSTPPSASKEGIGYVKLTYDNGALRWVFRSDYGKNGIECGGPFKTEKELKEKYKIFDSLPALGKNQNYCVLKFDNSYVFAGSAFEDGRYTAVTDGNTTFVAVVSKDLVPEIDLTEMIRVSTSWFGLIIGILQNLVFNVSAR